MAKQFLTDINLNKLQLQNAVIHPLGTAPSTGTVGQLYYNTTDKNLYQHDGSSWKLVGTTYDFAAGTVSSNSAPITLTGADGTTDTIYIKGAGGATITQSNGTITITTANTNTTYTLSGALTDSSTTYTVTLTPSSGSATTAKVPAATTSTAGLMSGTDKTKLNGIATGAEVNQNAFSNVKVGSTTVAADEKTDTLELASGTGISLTPDATNDKVTIASSYGAGTQAQLEDGTDTSNKVWQPKILHDYISESIGAADAMRFKGTIGTGGDVASLPTTGVKIGDTYRVITAGTYAGQTCEIGDLIIATATTPTWTVAQTNIDGAITSISGTAPISVTGSGSSRTVSISAASNSAAGSMSSAHYTKLEGIETGAQKNRTYTSFTGKPTANQTPGFGDTVTISQISQSTTGQVSGTDRTITIPNNCADTNNDGLMSSSDKTALDNIVDWWSTDKPYREIIRLQAGQTSITSSKLWSSPPVHQAADASTYQGVELDHSYALDTTFTSAIRATFSIATEYTNDILIVLYGMLVD